MSRVIPAGGDLAGRWLSKFLTDHLAGERDLSPQTITSYRDAIKLLLTWLMADYLDRRVPHPGVGADADPLFFGPEHTRLTRWGVTKILARHVQSLRRRDPGYAAGLNVTPHVIRRTRAMHLLHAGVNLIYIRDLLGHADVSTTEIYARADTEAKRNAIESAYQSLTPEPLPDWTADHDLLEWLDHTYQ